MTRVPVTTSRNREFMRSTKPCMARKMGVDLATARPEMASMASVRTRRSLPITGSMPYARTMETTQVTGTGKTIMKVMSRVCCTTLASESVRVIIEPVPNELKSAPESASDFL